MPKLKSPEKELDIQRVVSKLFAQKGYHATSMREVGKAVGMTQSSLYNYFKSKEEILFRLMNTAMDEALNTLLPICNSNLPPQEKLNRVLEFYARYYAGDQDSLTLLVNEMSSLSKRHHQILLKKQRRYVMLIRSILEELSRAGQMKPIHPSVATFTFFGMVHYTIKWYSKDGPVPPEELAHIFVEIFTKGILTS